MDHYAADLAALTEFLDLKDAIHVGHSTGGGEVTYYLGQHGEGRVAKGDRFRLRSQLQHPIAEASIIARRRGERQGMRGGVAERCAANGVGATARRVVPSCRDHRTGEA